MRRKSPLRLRLKAAWHILRSGGFFVFHLAPDRKLYYRCDGLTTNDMYDVAECAMEVRDDVLSDAQGEANLEAVIKMLNQKQK
jgi:hypothetical protein